jgi:TetR/AcrR family transcriptional regulator, cholesterol catabolism regulator
MEMRARIIGKAHELFHKYGIRSVTMDEIASQLGMSKKTIYLSFADKDELVDATLQQHIDGSKCRCETDKERAENAIHEMFLTMDMVQELLADMSPTIFYDLEKFHPKTFAKLTEHRNHFLYKVIRANLEWGIKEELYRADIDVDVTTKIRLETMFLPFNPVLFPPNKYLMVKVEQETMEHFLYGVATAKSHKLIHKYKQQRLKAN